MIKEITSKTLLRKQKKIDPWFVSKVGMNLYRGCLHDCSYCDGRAEKYRVEGEFGSEVEVKVNALELLNKEMPPQSTLIPKKEGFVLVGGGVGDSYQGVENEYGITRKVLEYLKCIHKPIHMLTKSTLIGRDLDLIGKIHEDAGALVGFSISSTNDELSAIFEPGVPPPTERLKTLKKFKDAGVPGGVFLMPVIPHITDTEEIMEQTLKDIKEAGADYVVFSGMTLKPGRQTEHFHGVLRKYDPKLIKEYERLYPGSKWGTGIPEHYAKIHRTFARLEKRYLIPPRIPRRLFEGLVEEEDMKRIMYSHKKYLSKMFGNNIPKELFG